MNGSLTPLTPEQRLLLSAFVDGELDAAEQAQVDALMQRPDAQEYVRQMRGLRVLVGRHGAARAPAGLKSAVLAEVGPPEGKVIALPRATWTTAIAALAAMLIVGTALYFAPAMMEPDPQQPHVPVARGDRANPPETAERPGGAAPMTDLGSGEKEKAKNAGELDKRDHYRDAGEAANHAQPRNAAPGTTPPAPAPVAPPSENEDMPPSEIAPGNPGGGVTKKPGPAVGKAEEKERGDGGSGSGAGREHRKEGGPVESKGARGMDDEGADSDTAEDSRRTRRTAQDDVGDGHGGDKEKKDAKTDDRAGADKAVDGKPAEVVVSLKTEHGLAAQNDLLRVGALYGAARLGELPETGMEDVLVEVDESRLPALVAALQKLTGQQEYGNLEVPERLARPQPTTGSGESTRESARDVLPADMREKLEGKAEPSAKPAGQPEPARKVRLKVKLS